MNENAFLRRKWRDTGHDKISEFIREVKSDLTQETWGAVINRDKRPDLRTLMIMSAELNVSPDDLVTLLIARGEAKISTWIKPAQVTANEMKVIEKLRSLDAAKVKLVTNLINSLAGVHHGNG